MPSGSAFCRAQASEANDIAVAVAIAASSTLAPERPLPHTILLHLTWHLRDTRTYCDCAKSPRHTGAILPLHLKTMSFYRDLNERHSYRKGIFLAIAQQGEGEAEGQSGGFGASPGGGRGVSSLSSPETSQISFLFAAEDRSRPSQSTPPLFVTSPASPGESPPTVLGRRRSGAGSPSEETVAIQRSGAGSPASPASPWSSTSEALSPQLIGGRAEADANFLTQTPDSVDTYKSSQLASTTAHLRSLIANLPTPVPLPVTRFLPARESSPDSIHSRHSNKSISSISSISDGSSESSYAFGLRRRKPDLRLLKKKSKPSQHLIQKPSILKLPSDGRRSPSFYKPKVVEDTGVVESTTKHITPPPPSEKPMPLSLSELLRTDPDIKPIRKVQTLNLPDRRPDLLRNSPNDSKSRPNLRRRISAKNINSGPQRRQLRFGSPQILETKRHHHDVTPPEDEPSVSGKSPFRHGDSYFHTFGSDTMYNEEFIPPRPPQAIEERKQQSEQLTSGSDSRSRGEPGIPLPSLLQPDIAEPPVRKPKKRNSSAFFNIFRLAAFKDVNVFELPSKRKARTPPRKSSAATPVTPAATPGIMVSSPVDSQRCPSIVPELTIPSYFARPPITRGDSQTSLTPISPALSPGAVPMIPGELIRTAPESIRKSRAQNRSSSEALSPFGTPRNRQRRYRESSLENAAEVHDEGSYVSAPASRSPSAGSRSAQVNEGSSYGNKSGSIQPSPGADVDVASQGVHDVREDFHDATLKKKPSIWTGLSMSLRQHRSSTTLEDNQAQKNTIAAIARRSTLSLKTSLSRINLRPSTSTINVRNGKLAKKSSILLLLEPVEKQKPDIDPQAPAPTSKPRPITPSDLTITSFTQTPFSQRYHDTQRATQQAIRSFISDTLDEESDDETDNDIVLGFETDVPDHLPDSPLCPLHPKHKSGGKAICPLHGRSVMKKKKRNVKSLNRVEIVFDTQEQGRRMGGGGTDGGGDGSEVEGVWRRERRAKARRSDEEGRGRRRERGEGAWEARRRRRRAGKRRVR
ncbi:uncharacterized protein MYCFIDRAFT_199055 [Pseudocercospora fijiensis CIRAD86]|uniref:Uncharacterized protein n=1 Tax=Pseudocercospora fijiensis (strain CIRAD86) TaxID=383855 RepID=M2YNE5_PSEFD|nr:uncharacterized protein MYCFIDRAFT_199055 [Pseudocercospora fijiensis CIRAD86]EME79225.1 hypothetical protein MYCFIDRAFT_199055 [Pseudocercospora fijiensis CIRAD86]